MREDGKIGGRVSLAFLADAMIRAMLQTPDPSDIGQLASEVFPNLRDTARSMPLADRGHFGRILMLALNPVKPLPEPQKQFDAPAAQTLAP